MIELRRGDILQADAEALVNTVNCVGVMGRGIAFQFRKTFPENFAAYKSACDANEMRPGKMFVYALKRLDNPRFIINFPTKRHWKGNSRIEDIKSGLAALIEEMGQRNIRSIAVPPLGCGLGGLDWKQVKSLIEDAFAGLPDVHVLLFEPGGIPKRGSVVRGKTPEMTAGRAALLGLMERYLGAVMDPFVSLLEIHKLMYFMQESGETLRLRFAKGPYGPYAENLRHVLNAIEGHYITGYAEGEDRPDVQVELASEAAEKANAFLQGHTGTLGHFDRVADLIEGFETSFGMELLATVHWVARHEGATGVEDAVRQTYAWNQRKRMFQEDHIRISWEVLEEKGWLC